MKKDIKGLLLLSDDEIVKSLEKKYGIGYLQIEIKRNENWMNIYYKNFTTYMPSKDENSIKWSLLCAQSLSEYNTIEELEKRINGRLLNELVGKNQDVNGLIDEYFLFKKTTGKEIFGRKEDLI